MAKVMIINGIRCVPVTNKPTAETLAKEFAANAIARQERKELRELILSLQANEILASI